MRAIATIPATPGCVNIEVRNRRQQRPMAGHIVLARQETQHIAAVAKEAQRLLALARRRGQHQHHHAEVAVDVQPRQRRLFLQDLHPAGAGHVQDLAIGMVAVAQCGQRLPVDRLVGHHPQHQAGVALKPAVEHLGHGGGGQQGFAAAGGHLQADIGDGPAGTVKSAAVGLVGKGRWQLAGQPQGGPGLGRKVRCVAQHVLHALHRLQRSTHLRRLGRLALQLVQQLIHAQQHLFLEGLQLHARGARLRRQAPGGGLPQHLALRGDLLPEGVAQLVLPPDAVHRVHHRQGLQRVDEQQQVLARPARRIHRQVNVGARAVRAHGTRAKQPQALQPRRAPTKCADGGQAGRLNAVPAGLEARRAGGPAGDITHRRVPSTPAAAPPARPGPGRGQRRPHPPPPPRRRCARCDFGTCAWRPSRPRLPAACA